MTKFPFIFLLCTLCVNTVSNSAVRKSGNRLLSGLADTFLLLGGIEKFFMSIIEMFAQKIALSNLPFLRLFAFAGQAGEITAGIVLFTFFVAWPRLQGRQANRLFALANLLVVISMTIAVYVHLNPDVPAEVLLFQLSRLL